jgi:hypothetical protein
MRAIKGFGFYKNYIEKYLYYGPENPEGVVEAS